jgi:hypothetical protein
MSATLEQTLQTITQLPVNEQVVIFRALSTKFNPEQPERCVVCKRTFLAETCSLYPVDGKLVHVCPQCDLDID